MPNLSPVPVAPSAPPGPSASASHGPGDTPATNFMDVLTDHQARTDLPEGQADGDDSPQATSEQPPAGDAVVTAPADEPQAASGPPPRGRRGRGAPRRRAPGRPGRHGDRRGPGRRAERRAGSHRAR